MLQSPPVQLILNRIVCLTIVVIIGILMHQRATLLHQMLLGLSYLESVQTLLLNSHSSHIRKSNNLIYRRQLMTSIPRIDLHLIRINRKTTRIYQKNLIRLLHRIKHADIHSLAIQLNLCLLISLVR